MITFILGLSILIIGGIAYGALCQKIMKPDDKKETPAFYMKDSVDYVPMKKWKNSLIQLLNIAGTGPILGPIQGILFGPIAFLTIPVGCVLGGAIHDYMIGLISLRSDGGQMPTLIRKFLGKNVYYLYIVFICLLLLLVCAVFIYTPGNLFVTHILGKDSSPTNPIIWIAYSVILLYYICATLFPIDKIIGKVYPIFGGILLLSSIGVLVGIFTNGYQLDEIWETGLFGVHPQGLHFVPIFFVTVACGIVSGFHSTQSTLVSRTIEKEKDGRSVFFNMMIAEGIIAMIWAAAAMGAINLGLVGVNDVATSVVGSISKNLLGSIGGIIAIIGIIVLPITSGDTALRSLRLILEETFKINRTRRNRVLISLAIFTVVVVLLLFSQFDSDGFNILWRYFSWANQVIAVFSFAVITVYMIHTEKPFLMSLIPGTFYMFVITSFIANATIGFELPWNISYTIAGILSLMYFVVVLWYGKKTSENNENRLKVHSGK